jgi:protein TonB
MTNKEILQADMLDILFEHRNKLYGAYALRRNYTKRLGVAIGVALSTVLIFLLMSFINKKNSGGTNINADNEYKVTKLELPDEKPKEPEKPKEQPKPETAVAKYNAPIVVPDVKADTAIATMDDIKESEIGDENRDGKKDDGIVKPASTSTGTDDTPVKQPEKTEPELPSRPPSFPGGTEAWLAFLQRYLQAPESLEPGQRIEVHVRFWIDVDGSVSRPEIIKSGGGSFDKEVLRAMKKMPRWEPAMQKGNYVAVAYTQPVTFLGVEE